jgi:putative membrane-bound dehydrogenase-like protein
MFNGEMKIWFTAILLSPILALAAEELSDKDLPRYPAVPCDKVAESIKIKPGFRAELVACEPLTTDPIAVSIDENGKMYVVEMNDYSELRNVHPHLGKISVLEDTDGDGKYDKRTLFADDLPWPTGVICYNGGVFVAASPDIYYLKDTKGTGKADVRKIIYTGFGAKKDKLNVQALVNGFNWGLDNRIHGLAAGNGGYVTNLGFPSQMPLDLERRNFSFNPRNYEWRAEAGGGQYGLGFDSRGRKFTCSNADHIDTFMYELRYDRNPLYSMPPSMVSIPVDGGAAEVFRISPEEPWRQVRTKWRVSGVHPGMIEGGGKASGYFTSACGITMYQGDVFPEEFADNAFIAEPSGNLVSRKIVAPVSPDKVAIKAERATDEKTNEFFASTDLWCRPVAFANAPDGSLYLVDMYREIIEHPWSLPEELKQHLDLNSGNDRGRIYRIIPDNFKQRPLRPLGNAKTSDLAQTLNDGRGWYRDTAARLIYERQDKSAIGALEKVLKDGNRFGRLRALHALDGLGALREKHVVAAMGDSDWTIRAHAVELSEKFLRKPSSQLWNRLASLASDGSPEVRYQLAFTLGETTNPERIKLLAQIIERSPSDPWMQAAVFSSLAKGAGEMFAIAAADPQFRDTGKDFLRQLVELIGAKNNPAEVKQVIDYLASGKDPALSFAAVRGLGKGLERAGTSLAAVDTEGKMSAVLNSANDVVSNSQADPKQRVQAIQLLGETSFEKAGAKLLSLINLNEPESVQLAALSTVAKFNSPEIASDITNRWATLTPRVRSEALGVLLARPQRALVLLDAIQKKIVGRAELTTAQVKFLNNNRDKNVRSGAQNVLAGLNVAKRQDVVNQFMPSLNLKGDATHGKKLYEERCSSCHRLGGEGHALGPDLVTVQATGKEKMLGNILDPNREVAPQFQAYEVELKDGDSLIGLIANENANSVTVRQAFSKEETVPRSNIARIRNQNQSLMPEGLEAGLKVQDVADLLEYVSTAKGN